MTDLISREAVIATVTDVAVKWGVTGEPAILLATKNAIRALPAAQVKVKPLVWEPIDTAPKDGTRVILWRGPAKFGKQSEMVIAEWHGNEWQWPDEGENPCTHGEWSEEDRQGGYYSDGRYFTHWMPLPTAPVDASQTPDPVVNDPRVKALVYALHGILWMADEWYRHGGDETTLADEYSMALGNARATLAEIKGESHE